MNASVFYTQLTYCTLRSCNYHCVSRVFIYFYLQVWNCGVWCFEFLIFFFSTWFQPLLYHNHSCILHYLSLSLLSQSTRLVPNFTYIQQFCGLRYADWQTFSGLQYCSCKRNTPRVKYSTRLKSGSDSGESQSWTQVRAIYILTTLSSVFSHGPMLDHKALVAPDPTH